MFTFTVDDGFAAQQTSTFTISVTGANDAPTLTTVSTLTSAQEDQAYTITYAALVAAANEADVDAGAVISFRVAAVTTGTLTKGGTPVVAGTTLLSTGETLVWTPAANANGTLNAFTVEAYDGELASVTPVQVQVTVNPQSDESEFDITNTTTTVGTVDANDVFVITGTSASQVTYAVAANTTVAWNDGVSLDTITFAGLTTELDGNQIMFANGTVLKTNQGGADTLVGSAVLGGDQLIGGNSGDTLKGLGGHDTIRAGSGADTVIGGTGNDTIYLADDAAMDIIQYSANVGSLNDGTDVVYGFDALNNEDKIKLTDVTDAQLGASFSSYVTSIAQVTTNTVVTLVDGNTITLIGVTATDVTAADFIGYM